MLKMVKSGTSVEKACVSIKHKHKTVDKVEVKELIINTLLRSNCLMSRRAQLYIHCSCHQSTCHPRKQEDSQAREAQENSEVAVENDMTTSECAEGEDMRYKEFDKEVIGACLYTCKSKEY